MPLPIHCEGKRCFRWKRLDYPTLTSPRCVCPSLYSLLFTICLYSDPSTQVPLGDDFVLLICPAKQLSMFKDATIDWSQIWIKADLSGPERGIPTPTKGKSRLIFLAALLPHIKVPCHLRQRNAPLFVPVRSDTNMLGLLVLVESRYSVRSLENDH